MHHARGVGRAQRRGDLHGEIERLAKRDGTSRQALAQRLAFHELHRDELLSVRRFAECVDGADVRVIEGGGRTSLLLEAGDSGRVLGQVRGQHLEGDLPVELAVAGQPHFPHAAFAQRSDNFIRVQLRPRTDRHTTARV